MDKLIAGVGEPTVVGGRSGFLPALNVMEDVAHYALLLRELASLLTTAFSELAGDVRQSIIGYGFIRINHLKSITLIWNEQRNQS